MESNDPPPVNGPLRLLRGVRQPAHAFLALQLPASHFMLLVQCGALGTLLFHPPERGAEPHPNRDPNSQPDGNVPGQNSGNRPQRRSQRDAQSRILRFARHLLTPENRRLKVNNRGASPKPLPRIAISLRPRSARPGASPPCPRSAELSPAVPRAACPKASQTTPAPGPPSWQCRR